MTKILVVDDHAVVRDGVKRMFDEQPGTVTFGGYPIKAGHSIASSTYRQSLVTLTRSWQVIDFR
jgi:DNA-binding NarL/FixJ family response regulator